MIRPAKLQSRSTDDLRQLIRSFARKHGVPDRMFRFTKDQVRAFAMDADARTAKAVTPGMSLHDIYLATRAATVAALDELFSVTVFAPKTEAN